MSLPKCLTFQRSICIQYTGRRLCRAENSYLLIPTFACFSSSYLIIPKASHKRIKSCRSQWRSHRGDLDRHRPTHFSRVDVITAVAHDVDAMSAFKFKFCYTAKAASHKYSRWRQLTATCLPIQMYVCLA